MKKVVDRCIQRWQYISCTRKEWVPNNLNLLVDRKNFKKIKKLLTNINKYVKLIWLLKKQQTRTLIIEQQPSLKIQNKFSERTLLNE